MTAERLRRALAALPVTIETAACRRDAVAIDGYPDGLRPTSVVTLVGGDARGDGEYVGWSTESHDRFAADVADLPTGVTISVAAWSEAMRRRVHESYARAAYETAAIALALTQAQTSLAALAGRVPHRPRMVRSVAPGVDPWPALAPIATDELKLDVDPRWTPATWRSLAERVRVAVVDFKNRGDAAIVRTAHDAFPDAWLEDPPAAAACGLEARVSLDGAIVDVATLARCVPAAVNVKIPRMGGLLEALDAVAWCERQFVPFYFGGMWEVGPGRALSQSLAALLAPDAPNDVAPLARDAEPAQAWPVSQVTARSPRIKLRNAISGATFTTQK